MPFICHRNPTPTQPTSSGKLKHILHSIFSEVLLNEEICEMIYWLSSRIIPSPPFQGCPPTDFKTGTTPGVLLCSRDITLLCWLVWLAVSTRMASGAISFDRFSCSIRRKSSPPPPIAAPWAPLQIESENESYQEGIGSKINNHLRPIRIPNECRGSNSLRRRLPSSPGKSSLKPNLEQTHTHAHVDKYASVCTIVQRDDHHHPIIGGRLFANDGK